MRTVLLNEPGKLTLIDRPTPGEPGAGEALVRVHRSGVCGTDMHAYRGRQPFFTYPRVLGHELGVEVVAVGENVSRVKPGDRCCLIPYLNCGECIACRRGKTNCCTKLRVMGVHVDGGYCDYLKLPADKLFASTKLSYDQLALIETLGIGAHAASRGRVEADEWVLIIGVGPIGLSVAVFAQAAGAKVIAIDTNPFRLERCRKELGIEHTINAADAPLEKLREITNGDLATAVFDATGNLQSMAASFQYVANGGRLVFVGLNQGEVTFSDPEFHRREISLLATRNSLPSEFERIIKLVEDGVIDTGPWITHRASLDDVPSVFPGWLEPEAYVLKAMVEL